MKLKDIVTDIKTWLWVVGIIGVVVVNTTGFMKLPKKVEVVEEKIVENKEHIKQMANAFEQYMAVQKTVEEGRDKREQMMVELIKANSKNDLK